jgi:hypothetical protein
MPEMRRGGADPHRGLRSMHQLRLFEMLVSRTASWAIVMPGRLTMARRGELAE